MHPLVCRLSGADYLNLIRAELISRFDKAPFTVPSSMLLGYSILAISTESLKYLLRALLFLVFLN
jgi:hypothetical protein